MSWQVEVTTDLADAVAAALTEAIRRVLSRADRCSLALSGGRGPGPAFRRLAEAADIDFARVDVFQVDERVAPRDHPDRNLTLIENEFLNSVSGPRPRLHEMPVDGEPDPDGYARLLPPSIDVVHLGLGPDGHTASLVGDDPVLDVRDRLVGMSGPYQGYVRMTLTYPALDAAGAIVFMVDGEAKRDALSKLIARDPAIPAGRLQANEVLVLTDVSGA